MVTHDISWSYMYTVLVQCAVYWLLWHIPVNKAAVVTTPTSDIYQYSCTCTETLSMMCIPIDKYNTCTVFLQYTVWESLK